MKLVHFFKTTVGARQGCILSPVLFNIYLENMQETLDNFESSISIGGRHVNNLRFVDDIDLIAGSESELQELTTKLETVTKNYGMEINIDKSKILINSYDDHIPTNIVMNGQ
jgi:hypothetical protein